jgi:hypothetical protein
MEHSLETKVSDQVLDAAHHSYERGDVNRSIHLYLEAVGILEGRLGSGHLRLAQPLMRLGNLYEQSGNNLDAERFFRRAAEVLAKNCAERTNPESMKLYTVSE